MSRGPWTFRPRDLTRAFKAAKAAGLAVDIRIDRQTGDLVIVTKGADDSATKASSQNEWDVPLAGETRQ
jgi:hypothetical protein